MKSILPILFVLAAIGILFQNCGEGFNTAQLSSNQEQFHIDDSEYTDVDELLGLVAIGFAGKVETFTLQQDGGIKLTGWACLIGSPARVTLKIKYGTTYTYAYTGKSKSSGEVNEKCETVEQSHNFEAIIKKQYVDTYPGQLIYLIAYDTEHKVKDDLEDSGKYKLPGKLGISLPSKLTVASPTGPANPEVTVHGLKPGSRVRLFSDKSCETEVDYLFTEAFGSTVKIRPQLVYGKKYKIYAAVYNGVGACSTAYVDYSVTDKFVDPPGNINAWGATKYPTVVVMKGVQKGDRVSIYTDSNCSYSSRVGSSTIESGYRADVDITLSQLKTYDLYARIDSRNGVSSKCSNESKEYTAKTDYPPKPSSLAILSQSGEKDPFVEVTGRLLAGDEVRLYVVRDKKCSTYIGSQNVSKDSKKATVKANLKTAGVYKFGAEIVRKGYHSPCYSSYAGHSVKGSTNLPNPITFKGQVDGFELSSRGGGYVKGWACIVSYDSPVTYRVMYKKNSAFYVLDERQTSSHRNSQHNTACKTGTTPHYFFSYVSEEKLKAAKLVAQPIYVEVLNPKTDQFVNLDKSGDFTFPDPDKIYEPVFTGTYSYDFPYISFYFKEGTTMAEGSIFKLYKDSNCTVPAADDYTLKRRGETYMTLLTNLEKGRSYKLYGKNVTSKGSSKCSTSFVRINKSINLTDRWVAPGVEEHWENVDRYVKIRNKIHTLKILEESNVSLLASSTFSWPHATPFSRLSTVSRIKFVGSDNGDNCARTKANYDKDPVTRPFSVNSYTHCTIKLMPGTYEIEFRGVSWAEGLQETPDIITDNGYGVIQYEIKAIEKP